MTKLHQPTQPPTIQPIQKTIRTICIFGACWWQLITRPRKKKVSSIGARSLAIRMKFPDWKKNLKRLCLWIEGPWTTFEVILRVTIS